MRKAAIERVEASLLASDRETFRIGDAVEVAVKIQEGDKQRVQMFGGTVIGRKGKGAAETFTVRRIVAGEGVERTFPLHSPHLAFVRVVRSGKVRRAKLYYLRQRVGKATRLSERYLEAEEGAAAPPAEGAAPADAAEGQ
jgi:large subunit ribosomal protein L19